MQTHLENPTKFHIQQSQRQQVKQYLSATLCNKVATQTLGVSPLALSSSAPEMDPIARSAPNSSMALHNLGSNKEEVCGMTEDRITLQYTTHFGLLS